MAMVSVDSSWFEARAFEGTALEEDVNKEEAIRDAINYLGAELAKLPKPEKERPMAP